MLAAPVRQGRQALARQHGPGRVGRAGHHQTVERGDRFEQLRRRGPARLRPDRDRAPVRRRGRRGCCGSRGTRFDDPHPIARVEAGQEGQREPGGSPSGDHDLAGVALDAGTSPGSDRRWPRAATAGRARWCTRSGPARGPGPRPPARPPGPGRTVGRPPGGRPTCLRPLARWPGRPSPWRGRAARPTATRGGRTGQARSELEHSGFSRSLVAETATSSAGTGVDNGPWRRPEPGPVSAERSGEDVEAVG